VTTQSTFIWDESFKAAADLKAKQYFAVKLTAADTVNLVAAAADTAIGILMNKPEQNQAALVRILGIAPCVSDGSGTAIAVGDRVGSNASGKMVKKATADFAVAGIALDASSADGTVIRVMLLPGSVFRTAAG
jgi:hypothetical protein